MDYRKVKTMRNPISILFKEHQNIIRLVHYYYDIADLYKTDEQKYQEIVTDLLNFFKNYADKYHHRKEEDLLFPKMCEKNELLSSGIIGEMLENHSEFREQVGKVRAALEKRDYENTDRFLREYLENLMNHIAVENGEVFHIAEELFSEEELENIYFRFEDADNELGMKEKAEMEKLHLKLQAMRHSV